MPRRQTMTSAGDGPSTRFPAGPPVEDLGDLRSFAFERMSANAAVLDGAGTIVSTNEAWRLFAHLNGLSPASVGVGVGYLDTCDRAAAAGDRDAAAVASGLRSVLHGQRDRFSYEYHCPSPTEDRWFSLEASWAPVAHGAGLVVFHVDITARKQRERWASVRAERDLLTGLPDRTAAVRVIDEHLASAKDGAPFLLVLDIDAFRAVNDRHGREVGDELLVKVAVRAAGTLGSGSSAGAFRLGDDRFALVCPDLDERAAVTLADRLRAVMTEPFQVAAAEIAIDVTVGVAVATTSGEVALGRAEQAVRAARAGSDRRSDVATSRSSRHLARRGGGAEPRGALDSGAVPVVAAARPSARFDADALLGHPQEGAGSARWAGLQPRARSHDPLTSLADRRSLVEVVDTHLARPMASDLHVGLVLVDIAPLDVVHDAFGLAAGDQVIVQCAEALLAHAHAGDRVARFADHTFAVCCPIPRTRPAPSPTPIAWALPSVDRSPSEAGTCG